MTATRHRRLILILACTLTLGCTAKTETNFDRGLRDKVLHIGNGSEPVSLDPAISTGNPEYHIQLAIFEGLVSKNNKSLAIEPAVAKAWEVSEDGRIYTFTLRDDAKWSNGEPVIAQDFVNAWQRVLSPALASQYSYMLYYLNNAEAYFKGEITDFAKVGATALSHTQLQVELAYPTPFFLQLLDHHSYYPVHKASIEKHGGFLDQLNSWTLPEHFVGNGPFTLDVWDVNRAIEVKRNPYYWDQDRIKLKRIVFYPIEEKSAEDRAFRAGQIHMTHTPQFATEKIAVYQEKNPQALRIFPTYSSYYFIFNTTKAPFDNVKVRRAMAMAVDRDTIVKSVMKGGEPAAYSVVPIDPEGFKPQPHFGYDVERARALLSEAGYPNGEGFPEIELLYNNDDVHRKVALTLQQMFKLNLNIDVQLVNQEWKVYLSSRRSKDFDFARAGWMADYLDPSNFLEIFYSFSGNNHTGWGSDAFDQLLSTAQKTLVREERLELFAQADKILADEMPAIPLFYYAEVNLVAPEVRGWHDDVMNYNNFKDVDLVPVDSKLQ